jgi:prepilin-type N-terminal cleavage/methylation domain-containing protein
MGTPAALSDDRGFTLVEVLVAMLILLGGVLGVVSLLDGANAQTASAGARVGATNLAREITEDARSLDYQRLTDADIVGQLRTDPDLAGTLAGSTWTITRKGVKYTVAVDTCIYDDASDKAGTHSGDYCSTSAQPAAGATGSQLDLNPDDFRRVNLTITWKSPSTSHVLRQTAMIVNPSGGLGPRILSFLPDPTVVQPSPTSSDFQAASFGVPLTVTTTYAETVHWTADDGASSGDATGGHTSWNISWTLGPRDTPTVYDGTYTVGAQAFDERSIPGDLRAVTVIINRRAPFAPSLPSPLPGGGYDTRQGDIVDLEWGANPERDVIGYHVYRNPDGVRGNSDDQLVCPASSSDVVDKDKRYCSDLNPPSLDATHYYVKAVDLDDARPGQAANKREGDPLDIDVAAASANTSRPTWADPTQVPNIAVSNGQPVLTWDTNPASDPDGIRFYRIYRDGDPATGYAGRYDRTNTNATTYTDPDPGSATSHTYWVTAVDGQFNESDPLPPVTVNVP